MLTLIKTGGDHGQDGGLLARKAMAAAVRTLCAMMESHDAATAEHMRRVGELSAQLGQRLGLAEPALEALRWGGELHDIGKLAISSAVLHKAEPLTSLEYHRIERHPVIGEYIARLLPDPPPLLPAIRHHHERLDGSGYPDRLAGAEIPLVARVVAVADAFDAMVSPRSYQEPRTPHEALAELAAGAGRLWDQEVVAALADHIDEAARGARAVGERRVA